MERIFQVASTGTTCEWFVLLLVVHLIAKANSSCGYSPYSNELCEDYVSEDVAERGAYLVPKNYWLRQCGCHIRAAGPGEQRKCVQMQFEVHCLSHSPELLGLWYRGNPKQGIGHYPRALAWNCLPGLTVPVFNEYLCYIDAHG